MPGQDTIKLLRECDAGVKMGISSIGDVTETTGNKDFRKTLEKCKTEHEQLEKEIEKLLEKYPVEKLYV